MESGDIEKADTVEEEGEVEGEEGEGTPVCINCLQPIDPLNYYCPHCGEASGQLTHYLPFVNLRWIVTVYIRIWRQIWSRDVSIVGRIIRFLFIVWNAPILLIGLLFKIKWKKEKQQCQQNEDDQKKI